ncbi:MAG: pilus assembly protein [Acidobacteriaceae bacterium]|nr:pilus assembly protein [Acidobacteriaceae bacterium]
MIDLTRVSSSTSVSEKADAGQSRGAGETSLSRASTTAGARFQTATSERGSAIIEFGIVLLPLLGFLFLTLDVAWGIFAKATLQEAAREGVRFAVTCGSTTGLDAATRQVVQKYSFGFITSANKNSDISIQYYSPSNLSSPVTGQLNATAGGNIVQVSISGISVKSFGSIFRSKTPLSPTAIATDVMESSPGGIACLE